MTPSVAVHHFPGKPRCQHGVEKVEVRQFSGARWWEARDCAACWVEYQEAEWEADAEGEAFRERLKARREAP